MSRFIEATLDHADGGGHRGFVEALDNHRLRGWCVDLGDPRRPIELEFVVADQVLGRARTLLGRSDVEERLGKGARAGFEFDLRNADSRAFDAGLTALRDGGIGERFEVRVAATGEFLPIADGAVTLEALEGSLRLGFNRKLLDIGAELGMSSIDSTKATQSRGGFLGRFGGGKGGSAGTGIPRGCIDLLDGSTLRGWALAGGGTGAARAFAIAEGEEILTRFEANEFRQDLLDAGIGDGHHGFSVAVPAGLFDGREHVLCIFSVSDDAPVPTVEFRLTLAGGVSVSASVTIEGNVDGVFGPFAAGWARSLGGSGAPLSIEVFYGGASIGRAPANEFRDDLRAVGKGEGTCGFRVPLPASLLSGRAIDLVVKADGHTLVPALRRPAVRAKLAGTLDRVDHTTLKGSLREVTPSAEAVRAAVWCDDTRIATIEALDAFQVVIPDAFMDGRSHRFVLATEAPCVVLDELVSTPADLQRFVPCMPWLAAHDLRTPLPSLPPSIGALATRITASKLFDASAYAAAVGEAFSTPFDAVLHHLRTPSSWKVTTSVWLDVYFVASIAREVAAGTASPLEWYFGQSADSGAGPNALFSNVEFNALAAATLKGRAVGGASAFDAWLDAAAVASIAPSVFVDPRWVVRGSGGSNLVAALEQWLKTSPGARKASALHPYFDDDWIAQACLLAQRKPGKCLFTSYRKGELVGVAPHAILHRSAADTVDFIEVLRSYELRFIENGQDSVSRVCPHFDLDAFRKVVESLGHSAERAPSLARYLASSPALRHRSFLVDVDDAFFAAQYPGLVDYCEKARGVADVNRIAARWVKTLDLPTQIDHAVSPPAGMLGLHDLGALRSFRSKLDERPRVSFLIPSYGRDDLVLRCVLSAIQSPGASAIEFFVAEDADHIDCGWILGYFLPFVTLRRNATNLGFLRSCNAAVQQTRGEIVLLVNNDVIVHRDAVNELLAAFDAFPRAGVMGGLILNRDGTIQENGGVLWRDASAWNYRRNRALDAESLFNTREADYVSGCWFGVRRAVWDEVGGFDDRFAPAYCEESDLCMTVRHRGYEVRVAPHSVVTHLDGATMGQDENGNSLKAYQRINREKLVHKWRHVLARHNVNGDVTPFHTGFEDGNRSIVIVFDHYVPEHDRDAGSRTIFAMLKALAAVRDNYIVFIPMNNARGKYAKALERMGIEVISGGEGWARFDELLTKHPARIKHAFVSRLGVAAHFVWHLDQMKCPKSIYLHDIEALRAFPTGAESALGDELVACAMDRYAERHRAVLGKFDYVLSCSTEETAILKAFVARSVVDVFPYNHAASVATDDVASRRDILFVGSYNHPPNREAIEYFLENVWPDVRERLPGASLHICGSGFENATFAADPRVIVHGHVTDATLAYLYGSSRVALAPLISGAGIKGKVIEACANGVFPLGSAAAWQGIEVPAGYEFLAGSMESFGARLVTAYQAFDFRAREALIAFYEGLRRTNNIDDVLPALANRTRRSR